MNSFLILNVDGCTKREHEKLRWWRFFEGSKGAIILAFFLNGFLILNVDGCARGNTRHSSGGGVLRDHERTINLALFFYIILWSFQ